MRSRLALPPTFSEDALRRELPAGIELAGGKRKSRRRVWIDTFDWRLAGAGLRAFYVRERPARFRLTLLDAGGEEASCVLPAAPELAADLRQSPEAAPVARAAGIRRLLPRVAVRARRSVYRILDDERKTIGRLALERRRAGAPDGHQTTPLRPRAVVLTVRGFDREVAAVIAPLTEAGLLTEDDGPELEAALASIGRAPRDYTSKLRFDLRPEMPATEALALSFSRLLEILRVNEPGLVARLDIEFLHDYRVAVRRTRSLLSHFGELLPARSLGWARSFFADLGRRTGAARDLDVLLLELPAYGEGLPAAQRLGLVAMRSRFQRDVAREYAAFGRWLGTKSYRRGIERWRRTIERLAEAESESTIAQVAGRAIRATAARVFKQAKKIRKSAADEPVHRLRIRCKKLRYVLEFSRSLTPGGEVSELISALKRLQNVLGTFQDLVVHVPRLEATAAREPVDPDLILATGWLLGELQRRHRETRGEVDETVERFRREGPPLLERVLENLAPTPQATP